MMKRIAGLVTGLCLMTTAAVSAEEHMVTPIRVVADMNVGQTQTVRLSDGSTVEVRLLEVKELADPIRQAVRGGSVRISIDGEEQWIDCCNYNLPKKIKNVQVDCPVIKAYLRNSRTNRWGLKNDARLRFWPAGSPYAREGSIVYPIRQRWLPGYSQMQNEVVADHKSASSRTNIYYHEDLDFGGVDKLDEVLSACAGRVVSVGGKVLSGYGEPVQRRGDVVYVVDSRGWYYRYSHLDRTEPKVRLGAEVKAGQRIGYVGIRGASGGWAHLHFGIVARQPSGLWGTEDAYAYVREAYIRQYSPKVIALARPHHIVTKGGDVTLDATKSVSFAGKIAGYQWLFTDGAKAEGAKARRRYDEVGYFTEVLKVTDEHGNVAYDYAFVLVVHEKYPGRNYTFLRASYWPSLETKAGSPITFKARALRDNVGPGKETWDFGDGSPAEQTSSDPVGENTPDSYAAIKHTYARPGTYIVRVSRTNQYGEPAVVQLVVPVK